MALSKVEVKRITVLSLVSSSEEEDLAAKYDEAMELIGPMEDDGLFESGGSGNSRSSGRSGRSGGRGSGSRSSNRGNRGGGRGGRGGGGNDAWRDDPATDKQIDALYKAGADQDYSDDEIDGFTKGEASDILDDLN